MDAVPSIQLAPALALIAGLVLHLRCWRHGEWERFTPKLAVAHSALPILLVALFVYQGKTWLNATNLVARPFAAYCGGVFGSMIIYRLIWHPLRKFPGPIGAKLSGFWSVKQSVPDFHLHVKVQKLHKRYGDFVRIRPREISICHPDAVYDIHGTYTKCLKGPFYDLNYPSRSLHMTRDKQFHAQRRRLWNRGFGMNGTSVL